MREPRGVSRGAHSGSTPSTGLCLDALEQALWARNEAWSSSYIIRSRRADPQLRPWRAPDDLEFGTLEWVDLVEQPAAPRGNSE